MLVKMRMQPSSSTSITRDLIEKDDSADLFKKVEIPLIDVLREMEFSGIEVGRLGITAAIGRIRKADSAD